MYTTKAKHTVKEMGTELLVVKKDYCIEYSNGTMIHTVVVPVYYLMKTRSQEGVLGIIGRERKTIMLTLTLVHND